MKIYIISMIGILLPIFSQQLYAAEKDNGALDIAPSSFPNIFRLTYIPDRVVLLRPNQIEIGLGITHSNYWTGTKRLFLDGEISQWNIKFNYGILNYLEIGMSCRIFWIGGGIFDGLIEGFHRLFGFFNHNRELIGRDQLNYIDFDTNKNFGLREGWSINDINISYKLKLINDVMSLRCDIRIPIDSPIDRMAIQHTIQTRWVLDDFVFYFSIGLSIHRDAVWFDYQLEPLQIYGVVNIAWNVDSSNVIVFGCYTQSASVKNVPIFSAISNEFFIGLQHRLSDGLLLQLSIIEDGTGGNEPDVAFHASIKFLIA